MREGWAVESITRETGEHVARGIFIHSPASITNPANRQIHTLTDARDFAIQNSQSLLCASTSTIRNEVPEGEIMRFLALALAACVGSSSVAFAGFVNPYQMVGITFGNGTSGGTLFDINQFT